MLTEDEQLLGIIDTLYQAVDWQSTIPEPDDNQLSLSSTAKASPMAWFRTFGFHSVIDYVDTLARYHLSLTIERKWDRPFPPWRTHNKCLATVMIGTPPQGTS
jgi:hypothetical protein